MSDKSPEEKDGLLELIKELWLPVAGFFGAVTLAYNFYKMWLGDRETVTYFTAGGGLLILIIALGWIGFSTKTVTLKKKTKSEPRYSITYRRIALGLLGVVVVGSGVCGWLLYKSSVSRAEALEKKIIILVAQFDGPEETYGLRSQVMEELHKVAKGNNEITIIDGEEIITSGQGSDYARELGEAESADLVIWAWYKPTDNPNITIHFENLSPAQIQTLKSSETYQPQATVEDLKSFEIQQKIGTETKTLIAFIGGMANYQSGNYQEALSLFEAIQIEKDISTFIDSVTLHFYIAYSNFRLGLYEESIQDYDHVLEVNPSFIEAYNNRGIAYMFMQNYQFAIQDFDQALKLNPDYAAAYVNRGSTYDSLGDYQRAIQDYDQAIELDPNYVAAYINRGSAYGIHGDYERAKQDFDQAIELDPNGAFAYVGSGLVYYSLENYQQAIYDFDRAIELDPNYAVAYINRGSTYVALEDYQHAVEDFDQAIKLNPNYAEAYYNRGVVYKALGKTVEAESDFAKYKELTGLDAP